MKAQILRELNLRNRELSIKARQEVLKLPEPPAETGLLRTDLIEMKISKVFFGYRPKEQLLLNVGELQVPLGKIVALVGVHGSGKNTFLRLISSRLLPDSGEIFVPTHLRVLFVAQDPVLLDAGVWENLIYGAPEHSDLLVVKGVLKMLNMKNILNALQQEFMATQKEETEKDEEQGGTKIDQMIIDQMIIHNRMKSYMRNGMEWNSGWTWEVFKRRTIWLKLSPTRGAREPSPCKAMAAT